MLRVEGAAATRPRWSVAPTLTGVGAERPFADGEQADAAAADAVGYEQEIAGGEVRARTPADQLGPRPSDAIQEQRLVVAFDVAVVIDAAD